MTVPMKPETQVERTHDLKAQKHSTYTGFTIFSRYESCRLEYGEGVDSLIQKNQTKVFEDGKIS